MNRRRQVDYYPQDQHATLRAAMARMLASGDPAEVAFQLLSNARRVFVGDSLDVGWIEESSL